MTNINIRKQIVKAPKLHFLDTGLVCYLMQIREPGQLRLHPLRGGSNLKPIGSVYLPIHLELVLG
ncbi:MAG: hypothetical protein ACD_75C00732G0012 [uncultured bacterium]|nr:MAG: hypothetical protein ACD_75C00732G0012 [uncultured bacterium]